VAISTVLEAYESGKIGPDTTIIESSSGNLGIGLAQVCTYLGLRFICVVDTRTTPSNLVILKAYGVDVELVDVPDPITGDLLTARVNRVKQLCREIPGSIWINQYANEDNPRAHYQSMAEIAAELNFQVDYIFAATSTCGTLRGMKASRRPQTAIYSEGPGRRASVSDAQKPRSSTIRSACAPSSMRSTGSRRQVRSR